jgi:hypothetical protein
MKLALHGMSSYCAHIYSMTLFFQPAGGEAHAGSGVLVPASYTWTDTTVQMLQTFGILLRWASRLPACLLPCDTCPNHLASAVFPALSCL